MQPEQISINTITTKQAPLEQNLAAYAAAGFGLVELCIPHAKNWLAGNGRNPAQLKALLDQHRLRCVGGFETGVVCFGPAEKMQQNHDIHVGNSRLLAQLSGEQPATLVVGTDGPPAGEKPAVTHLAAIGLVLRDLAEKLHPSVRLALEFNWSPIVKSLRGALAVVETANHPRVGILFDPAHFHCTSTKFEDLTARAVRRIAHVHVNNMADKPGELSDCNADRVLPGDRRGTLDLKRLLDRVEELGYSGAFSLEMFSDELWKMEVNEAARRCHAAMRTLVG